MKPFIGTEKRSDTSKAWLLLTKTPVRALEGYKDDLSTTYSWDDRVPNGSDVAKGDFVVFWNGKHALGISVITRIVRGKGKKIIYRCPSCGQTDIYGRKNLKPTYRCKDCTLEFEDRTSEFIDVKTSKTNHAAGWIDLAGSVDVKELKAICHSPNSQQSIRLLVQDKFITFLESNSLGDRFQVPGNVQKVILGGHKKAVVRVRVGQGAFRDQLLKTYGDNCAISGPAPRSAIHAAHLYSFAKNGSHHDEGGLLLRADLHSMFDGGLLKVDVKSSNIVLDPVLERFDQYWNLNGQKLQVSLTDNQKRWMQDHWNLHSDTSDE